MMKQLSCATWVVGGCCLVCTAHFAVAADQVIAVGGVMFDFDTNVDTSGLGCAPDDWNFFRNPTVDFGANTNGPDGHVAFQQSDWTECDFFLFGCDFMGSGVGIGPFPPGQPLCPPTGSGIADISMDLSAGTGVTIEVALDLLDGANPPLTRGTEGVRLQFQFVESNGLYTPATQALPAVDNDPVTVTPRSVPGRPWVNRAPPISTNGPTPTNGFATYTFHFAGFDNGFDDDAVASTSNGLGMFDFGNVRAIKLIWRRPPGVGGGQSPVVNGNLIRWDNITLIDTPAVLWADDDIDGDVDLADFQLLQQCAGADLAARPECVPVDANFDGVIDEDDVANFGDCMQGPGIATDFFPWCY